MNKGFSLIELLTVLTIVSILVTFAYPSYRNYLTKAHRMDGQTALLDLANRMEHYFTLHQTYETATIGQEKSSDILNTPFSPDGWYRLSIVKATDSTYMLQATPQSSQAIADHHCQSLTFNHLGTKGITAGPNGSPLKSSQQCW